MADAPTTQRAAASAAAGPAARPGFAPRLDRRQGPHQHREAIPRPLLWAIAALVASSLAIATYARVTDAPLSAEPAEGPVKAERVLRIAAQADGAAVVRDADGRLIADLSPQEGGFISGVARAMTRVRQTHGAPADAPVRLVRYQDGRLALKDDATGWRVELMGFGRDNFNAFARLVEAAPAASSATGE